MKRLSVCAGSGLKRVPVFAAANKTMSHYWDGRAGFWLMSDIYIKPIIIWRKVRILSQESHAHSRGRSGCNTGGGGGIMLLSGWYGRTQKTQQCVKRLILVQLYNITWLDTSVKIIWLPHEYIREHVHFRKYINNNEQRRLSKSICWDTAYFLSSSA